MPNWIEVLTFINIILVVAFAIGGYIGIRSGMSKAASDIQKQLREDLEAENTLLRERIKRCEEDNKGLKADNKRLNRTMGFIISTLKKTHSLELEVQDDMITVRDKNGTKAVRIHITGELTP